MRRFLKSFPKADQHFPCSAFRNLRAYHPSVLNPRGLDGCNRDPRKRDDLQKSHVQPDEERLKTSLTLDATVLYFELSDVLLPFPLGYAAPQCSPPRRPIYE